MTIALASVALAGVFVAAGVAKLLDREGSREAARSFGVPDWLAGAAGLTLPLAEIAIALLLLPAATRWWAAVAALVLLLVFCGAIAVAMARGKAPDCHCFGQLHSAPAGWTTLARNGLLVLVASFVVVAGRDDPGTGAFAWVSDLEGVEWLVLALGVALIAVVAVGGYAVVHVMRSYGRVLVRLEAVEERLRSAGFELEDPDDMPALGLEPGSPAPAFELASIDGSRVSHSTTSASRATRSCSSSRARPAGRAPSSCRRSPSGSASTTASSRSRSSATARSMRFAWKQKITGSSTSSSTTASRRTRYMRRTARRAPC